MPARSFHRPSPGRILRLYALSVMARDGPVYGYQLAARVAERTAGAWTPGAGAVYPALGTLVGRGWASSVEAGRRRLYRITPKGRDALRRFVAGMRERRRRMLDIGPLWAEVVGNGDPGAFLIDRLDLHLGRLEEYVDQGPGSTPRRSAVRRRALARLEKAVAALRGRDGPPRGAVGREVRR